MYTRRHFLFLFLLFTVGQSFGQMHKELGLPIKPARIISFETDEGSYMNVDVSPDGKLIVFDLLGDLYTLPFRGGEATQITKGIALNLRPMWSKNGEGVYFVSDRTGDYKIHYATLSGGIKTTSLVNQDAEEYNAKDNSVESPNKKMQAFLLDTNGTTCLMVKGRENPARILVPGIWKNPKYRPRVANPRFAFSPDSKYVVIAYQGKIHRIEIASGMDEIIPFTARVNTGLGKFNYNKFGLDQKPFQVKYIRSANISEDGKRLVFQALNTIYVKELPYGEPRVLVKQKLNQYQPVFSPDGKWVAYVTWGDGIGGHLWRVSTEGGVPEQLTTVSGQYQHPVWSPDGNSLAVIRGAPRFWDRTIAPDGVLELIEISTKTVRVIDDKTQLWNQISFINGGSRIAYTPYEKVGSAVLAAKIISRNLEGADFNVEAYGTGVLRDFSQRILSPDSKLAVYCFGEDIFVKHIHNRNDSTVLFNRGNAGAEVTIPKGVDPTFSPDGKYLSWCYGNWFFRIPLSKIPYSGLATATDSISLTVIAPSSYANGTIALTNARIITMKGDLVISSGTLIINKGRISSAGPATDVKVPKGVKTIDLSGKTIIPGFVDTHLHMRLPLDVFPQQSWMYLANLAYGVTTARDPSSTYDSFGYSELLKTGEMIGPRLFSVGKALADELNISSLEEARLAVGKRKLLGATVVKQYAQATRIQRQWLTIAAKEAGLNVTNEGMFDPIGQIGMIKDGSTGIEHNPRWGDVYNDIKSLYAESGVFLTPTLQVEEENYGATARDYFKYNYWRNEDEKLTRFILSDPLQKYPIPNGPETIEMIRKTRPLTGDSLKFVLSSSIDAQIRKKGGMVTVGSHGNNQGIGVHNEIWALQMGGLSNLEALQAATIMGAMALGVQEDLGSLEVGKIADLIILNKNPLEDIHNTREIKYVMKDGVLYDGNTLNEIWPAANHQNKFVHN